MIDNPVLPIVLCCDFNPTVLARSNVPKQSENSHRAKNRAKMARSAKPKQSERGHRAKNRAMVARSTIPK